MEKPETQTTEPVLIEWPQLTGAEWTLIFASLKHAHRDFFNTTSRGQLAAIIRKLEEAVHV